MFKSQRVLNLHVCVTLPVLLYATEYMGSGPEGGRRKYNGCVLKSERINAVDRKELGKGELQKGGIQEAIFW